MTNYLGVRMLSLGFVIAASVSVSGDAQHPVLHPNGFGMHSYAAWKAKQGQLDSSGNKEQALYFQKDTTTPTFAAGVANIDGFEGEDANSTAVLPLAFDWRMDGHCGAGAPRFNVRIQPTGTTNPSMRQTVFVGCAAMAGSIPFTDSQGRLWQRKTFAGPLVPPGTITSLAIVFDEGNDVGPGFVYLDNIQVGNKIWTSSSDNSNDE